MAQEEFNSVTIYSSMASALRKLPPETELRLRHAIDDYELKGLEPDPDFEEDAIASGFWELMKPNLDTIMKNKRNAAKKKKERNGTQDEPKRDPRWTQAGPNNTLTAKSSDPKPDPNGTQDEPKQDPSQTQTGPDDRCEMIDDRWQMTDDRLCKDTPLTPQGDDPPAAGERAEESQPVPEPTPSTTNSETTKAEPPTKKRAAPFVPPTPEDVSAYATEIGHPEFDAYAFIDHYKSKGWMVGKAKMKDWKAALRGWIRRREKSDWGSAPPRGGARSPKDNRTDWDAITAQYEQENGVVIEDWHNRSPNQLYQLE